MSIKFVVDSSAELDKDFCEKNGIILMPNDITFGDEEYVAGETISNKEFYEKLTTSKILPKTALINQYRFSEVFRQAQENNDELVVLVISRFLSSTYEAALMAQTEVGYNKIYVVNHLTVTIAQKALILEALKMRDKGMNGKQIADEILKLKDKVKLYAAVATLKYLKEGGRLSGVAAVVGTMLNIKPIIELSDGKIFSNHKCIGFKKAKMKLIELLKADGFDENYPIYIAHTNDPVEAQEFEESLKQEFTYTSGGINEIGSVVGTHAGPGAVAVIFFKK